MTSLTARRLWIPAPRLKRTNRRLPDEVNLPGWTG
jgi:hypothetical protein